MNTRKVLLAFFTFVVIITGYMLWWRVNYYVTEHKEYKPPIANGDLQLNDDTLEEKSPSFKTDLIDSRPLGDWQVKGGGRVARGRVLATWHIQIRDCGR